MQLQRVYNTADPAVPRSGWALGMLRDDDGRVFWTTFEDKPIPAGTYTVKLMPAAANPKHGESWEVLNVPGRSDILFHVGNDADDSEGCILVGKGVDRRSITFSSDGYREFRRYLRALSHFTLTIVDPA